MIELIINIFRNQGQGLPGFFRLLDYITFRALMAVVTALIFNIMFGQKIIYFLYRKGMRDTSGDFESIPSYSKKGTPTAGGIMIVGAVVFSTLIWAKLSNPFIISLLLGIVYFAIIGFMDDFLKVKFKSSMSGLSQKGKTLLMLLYIVPFAFYINSSYSPLSEDIRYLLFFPFFKNFVLSLEPFLYFLFIVFFLFSIINSVNITDGMDGLLGGLSLISLSVYAFFSYIIGSSYLAGHYLFHHVHGTVEITLFIGALIGSIAGFLWYNFYPAEVFMGDTGSLAIGASMGLICIFIKQEILFLIVGGVFVFEIFTSLLNDKVANLKFLGRRIVQRAPFHHSMSHRGVAEPKTVFRILIIGLFLALFGLLSIKIR